MSRFEKFQNIQVFDAENEPLNEQLFLYDFLVNFENGFISNCKDNITPAITCINGYTECWENGICAEATKSEYDKKIKENKDKNTCLQKGIKAELAFAEYLNTHKIPFIHLDQFPGKQYSEMLNDKNIKRPDYLIFIDNKPLFIDVKATGCYTIDREDLEKSNNFKNEFQMDIIFAITDINEKEFSNYYFMSLDELNSYIEIIKNKNNTNRWYFYFYSRLLLKDEIISENFNNKTLEDIYNTEEKNKKIKFDENYFSNILISYFKENNYKMEKRGGAAA